MARLRICADSTSVLDDAIRTEFCFTDRSVIPSQTDKIEKILVTPYFTCTTFNTHSVRIVKST